jgi:hypothetical protein
MATSFLTVKITRGGRFVKVELFIFSEEVTHEEENSQTVGFSKIVFLFDDGQHAAGEQSRHGNTDFEKCLGPRQI